jgi:chromosome segregation ATPase
MGWGKGQVKLLNRIKRQEDALGTRRAPAIPAVDFWASLDQRSQRVLQAQADARERDRVASEAHQARQKAEADAAQVRQREWAEKRNELRDRVVELERALADAEQRVQSADMDIAIRGAAEVPVWRARLDGAQRAYAEHLKPQGWRPPAASATV